MTQEVMLKSHKYGIGMFLYSCRNNGVISLHHQKKELQATMEGILKENARQSVDEYLRGIIIRGYLYGIKDGAKAVKNDSRIFQKLYNGFMKDIGGYK
jgi:hypothetical protein